MPAMKTKSPARVPRFHVPVGLMAAGGERVFTPLGESCCASADGAMTAITSAAARCRHRSLYMQNTFAAERARRMRPADRKQDSGRLPLRGAGLQRQRVQLAAHVTLERLVNNLMLLRPRFAAERGRDHGRRIVVAVAGEVPDGDLG